MATSQTNDDAKKPQVAGGKDAGGHWFVQMGRVKFYSGSGTPTHAAPKGSLYVNVATGKLHMCETADNAAAGSWKVVTVS